MDYRIGSYLLAMPELQLAHEKNYNTGKGEKQLRNLNIERVVYFLMWAVIMVSYFFFGGMSTFNVRVLLWAGSLFFIGIPLGEVVVTFVKTRKTTMKYSNPITVEQAVYFLAWTGLLLFHFFVEEVTAKPLIMTLLAAGLTYFIGIPAITLIITLPKNFITIICEMRKEDIIKLAFFYGLLVYVLPHLIFDEPKAFIVCAGLYIMGVIIFVVFFIARLTVIQTLKFVKVTAELSHKARNQFYGGELPVRPEEFSRKPKKISYIYHVFGALIALTLFGVWVRYTNYDSLRYISQYSSYIILGGVLSIFLLWAMIRRIKEEKGDIIKGL